MRKKLGYIFAVLILLSLGGYLIWNHFAEKEQTFQSDSTELTGLETKAEKTEGNTKAPRYPLQLNDPHGDFSFESNDNFNFLVSDHRIVWPVSKDVSVGIAELQLYFGANDERMLEIIGLYTTSEKNTSRFQDLGTARANAVKDYLILQGIPSTRMVISGKVKNDLKGDGKMLYGPVELKMDMQTYTSEEK